MASRPDRFAPSGNTGADSTDSQDGANGSNGGNSAQSKLPANVVRKIEAAAVYGVDQCVAKRIFRLAIVLRQLPEYADSSPYDLEAEAAIFLKRSHDEVRRRFKIDDVVAALADAWPKVRAPGVPDALDMIYATAAVEPLPPYADSLRGEAAKELFRLLYALQRLHGSGEFWLDMSAASKTISFHRNTVSHWLSVFRNPDANGLTVLHRTKDGHTGRASYYRLTLTEAESNHVAAEIAKAKYSENQ